MDHLTCNEKDFALLSVVLSSEVEVINPISAILLRKLCSWNPHNSHQGHPVFSRMICCNFSSILEIMYQYGFFPLKLHELQCALITYRHPCWCSICLEHIQKRFSITSPSQQACTSKTGLIASLWWRPSLMFFQTTALSEQHIKYMRKNRLQSWRTTPCKPVNPLIFLVT